MSGNNLSVDGEIRYIVQWFNEWSELQREDFLPILIDYLTKELPEVYVNGVVSGLSELATCNDKPMSIFQCRIKLFKEWSRKWPEDVKLQLKEKIIEIDPKIGEKIEELTTSLTNGSASAELSPTSEQNVLVTLSEEVSQNA